MNYLVLACGLIIAGAAAAAVPEPEHPLVRSVLDQNYIPVTLTGEVDLDFGVATYLFAQENILNLVQDEYARQLPAGETPEFVVEHEPPNRWSYLNKKQQPSVITEVHRDITQAGRLELVYHVEGRRFFGDFESLVHVVITAGDGQAVYDVRVYAFPKVAVSRFLARHLGLIERYFRSKTDDVTELTVAICRGILAESDDAG